MNDLENLGKGAVKDIPDIRDYPAESQFGSAPPIDWSVPFRLPVVPKSNQHSSDACVAYSTSSLHWRFKGKNFSRRDLFSRIALNYGASLRDGVKQICTTGQQDQNECPDPSIPTPASMRVKSTKPDSAGMDDLEANYFVVKNNTIDATAQAIRDFQGCIMGVNLSNAGWKDKTNPRPPLPGETITGHAIDAAGYHLHNGIKCTIFESSWVDGTHFEHHIKENYYTSGNTFNAWCVIPKDQQYMTNSLLLKRAVGNKPDGTPLYEYGFFDPDTAEAALVSDMRNRGVNPPLKPDGTLDWDQVEHMVQGAVTSIN